MESAILGLILDSSILIEAERQGLDAKRLMKLIGDRIGKRTVALCAISVAQLAHGIHRADSSKRRQARRAFLDDLKATMPIYPITADDRGLARGRNRICDSPTGRLSW